MLNWPRPFLSQTWITKHSYFSSPSPSPTLEKKPKTSSCKDGCNIQSSRLNKLGQGFIIWHQRKQYFFWTRLTSSQLTCILLAQMVRPCNDIAKVMGLNPLQINASCLHNYSDLSRLQIFCTHFKYKMTFHLFILRDKCWNWFILHSCGKYNSLCKPHRTKWRWNIQQANYQINFNNR